MKRLLSCLIGLSIIAGVNAQNNRMDKLDSNLSKSFDGMMQADYMTRYDSLAPDFKSQLIEVIADPQNINLQFDSLSSRIKIVKSKDEKLRFYSWDEKTGGSWHTMMVVAQIVTANGKIEVKQISGEEGRTGGFTDAIIYEIHEIEIEDKIRYLTIAWGTHGGGHHHVIAQIFKIEGDNLVNCKSCFEINENLVVQAPRANRINLRFHPESKEITHHEFVLNDDIGFYKATGNIVRWKLKDGKFEKR